MKNTFFIVILIILPLCIFSQEMGVDYSNSYFNMDQKTLKNELLLTNIGTGVSVTFASSGAVIIGAGAYISLKASFELVNSMLELPFSFSPILDGFYYTAIMLGGAAIARCRLSGLQFIHQVHFTAKRESSTDQDRVKTIPSNVL